MRIGMVHPKFATVGGAEVLIGRYALHLRELGHEVRLATAALDRKRWPALARELDVRVAGKLWTDHWGRHPYLTKNRRRVARLAARLHDLDVVVAGNYPGAVAAVQAKRVGRTMWWCMEPDRRLHNHETFRHLVQRLQKSPASEDTPLLAFGRQMIERRGPARQHPGVVTERANDLHAVSRVDRIVAISHFSAESVRLVYGRDPDAVVYPTIPDSEGARRTPGIDPAGLRVLVHSRLERLKNVDAVFEAFAAFRKRHPGAHELHVVGRGPDEVRLQELARDLGLGDVARFHGFLTSGDLAAVYARCEIMALLPVDEPFGMVYPEAAQRGLLLAGADHGGPLEILEGGALGWALDIFSHEPLAEAFAEAWRLPIHEVERRREAAATSCRARFGPAATLPQVVAQITG